MSALRAIRKYLTRQRTYRPDTHWPIILVITLVEVGICLTLTLLTPWWIWLPALSLYYGGAPYCLPGGIGRPIADLLFAKRASYTYLTALALGALAVDVAFFAMLAGIAAVGVVCLAIGVMSMLIVGVAFLIYGVAVFIVWGWWLIVPVLVIVYLFRD